MFETDIRARTTVFVLAGGRGDRMNPLTQRRAKPAVPFGGMYRIIDFTLSNCFNSGLQPVHVLTQYRQESLHDYLDNHASRQIVCRPPAAGKSYLGTADAVYQNMSILEERRPGYVLILSADHIYRMDYSRLLRFHQQTKADATVAAVEHPRRMGREFGILEIGRDGRIARFEEKPRTPAPVPGKPGVCLASMGVYVFNADTLRDVLSCDAARSVSAHDFGRDVVPGLVQTRRAFAFQFKEGPHGTGPYWRDVGTINAYYNSQMELLLVDSPFDPYDDARWPIRAHGGQAPQSSLAGCHSGSVVEDSFVCSGASVSGRVFHSVVSPAVTVEPLAEVRDSVLMRGVHVGRGSRIRRAIVEDGVHIPGNVEIGYNPQRDRRWFHVTDAGVVVIRAGARFPSIPRSHGLSRPDNLRIITVRHHLP